MDNKSMQLDLINRFGDKTNLKIGCLVFVTEAKEHFFCDANGKYFSLDNVWGLSPERNYESGTKDLPRPFVLENDEIIEVGDNLVYSFVDDSEQNILILGSLTSYKINSLDPLLNITTSDKDSLSAKYLSRNNKQRFFSVLEDGKGNVTINLLGKNDADKPGTGNLAIKIKGTDKNGNVNLSMNGKFAITQTQTDGETETAIAQLLFDNTNGAEKIKVIDKTKNRIEMNKDGIILETMSIRIGKDETLKKILDDLISAVLTITQNTPSGPTVSPPLNKAQFDAIKNRIDEFMDKQ